MHQVCYTEVKKFVNEREEIKMNQEIRMPYGCIIKIYKYFIHIFTRLYFNYLFGKKLLDN